MPFCKNIIIANCLQYIIWIWNIHHFQKIIKPLTPTNCKTFSNRFISRDGWTWMMWKYTDLCHLCEYRSHRNTFKLSLVIVYLKLYNIILPANVMLHEYVTLTCKLRVGSFCLKMMSHTSSVPSILVMKNTDGRMGLQ